MTAPQRGLGKKRFRQIRLNIGNAAAGMAVKLFLLLSDKAIEIPIQPYSPRVIHFNYTQEARDFVPEFRDGNTYYPAQEIIFTMTPSHHGKGIT
jgi:hypothetical protein